MKAVILCAGYGKRLKPYTNTYQKTMIPVHGKPLLEYIIDGLKYGGFNDIIIVVGYRKEQIINYFQDGKKWDVKIEYIEQKILNGTGGALLLCENLIKDPYLFLTWGDTLVAYKIYKAVYDIFKKENPNFILVADYVEDPFKGAAIYCDGDYCLDIIEKPSKGTSNTNLNNTGIFILSREIFEVLKTQSPSERGELEVPVALRTGIKERNWMFRVIKMEKSDFMGDFGDKQHYENLKNKTEWLNFL